MMDKPEIIKPVRRFLALLVFTLVQNGYAQPSRIHYNNQDLFLSGANVAWIHFAQDIGSKTTDFDGFADIFLDIHENGGNAVRFWLHTTGKSTPEFKGSSVVGPGKNTIADLKTILDLAREREVGIVLCLWSFDMLRMSEGTTITDRSRDLLTIPSNTQSYIDNALIPMVRVLKGHPGIIAWEIFNEPEGMSNEFGWDFIYHVPMSAIQRFINLCGGAIHRTDPNALVTNGSWAFKSQTDVDDNTNYYTDDRLIAAGGDSLGTLDFYQVHYYSWAGVRLSPFHHPAFYWYLDKPIVVGEFFTREDIFGVSSGQLFDNLYKNGYAGALAWSYYNDINQRPSMLANMKTIRDNHTADVEIKMGPECIKHEKDETRLIKK